MVLPLRINTVEFEVRKLDVPNTELDPDFREPVGGHKPREAIVTVKGQLGRGTEGFFRMDPSLTGNAKPSTFHAVFRPTDLEAAGLVDPYFKPGDLFVSVSMHGDKRTLNFPVLSVRKGSALESVGKWVLLHVDCEQDRDKLGSR